MIDNRVNNHWTVYVHIIPKEVSGYEWDKYYVGITGQTPKRRWGSGYGYKGNVYFYRSIQKYGWENISHEIIAEHLTLDEACNMEISLIKALNANLYQYGYNLTEGGDTYLHRSYKGENNPQAKKIYQFDKDFNFIEEFNSLIEADIATNSRSAEAARDGYSSGGFYWAREDNIFVDNSGKICIKNKPVIVRKEIFQFDKNFNFINRYKSTRDACRKTDIFHTTINGSAKRKSICHGFYWLYKNDVDILDEIPKIKQHIKEAILNNQLTKNCRKEDGHIKIVNITNNELFSSIALAAKHYNIDSSYLRKTAIASTSNNNRTAKKCKWLLYDDYLKIYHLTNDEAQKSLFFIS